MYNQYYGLTQKPFENTPDSHFLFLSKQHREVLASLIYGIDSAKGFILVAGDIGTGKTTLVNSLLQKLDPQHIAINIINPRSSFSEILEYLAEKINISDRGKSSLDLIDAMRAVLEKLAKENRRVVLIIDEAHLLSDTALEDIRLLSNIECEHHKLIQIVLVGQNEIHRKLDRSVLKPLKQRLVIIRQLFPLGKQETRDYIRHRLKVAGRGQSLFDAPSIRKIYEKSRGTPRLINQICDNALLIGFATNAGVISGKIIAEVISDMGPDTRRWHGSVVQNLWTIMRGRALAVAALLIFILLPAIYLVMGDNWLHINEGPVGGGISVPASAENTLPAKSAAAEISIRPAVERNGSSNRPQMATNDTPMGSKPARVARVSNAAESPPSAGALKMPAPGGEAESDVAVGKTEINETVSDMVITVTDTKLTLSTPVLPEHDHDDHWVRVRKQEVLPNDWLRKIALREYGLNSDTVIDLIHMANPEIRNVNQIFPGQKLMLPRIERKDLVVGYDQGFFHIHYASFYNRESANKALLALIRDDKNGFMIPCRLNENEVYRVYIGTFDSYLDAEKMINTLNLKHIFLDKK